MVHFSVDDTIEVFRYLTENKCKSIFENPLLRFFKKLNNEYSFAVSMYCFYEKDGFNLSLCSDKYKDEFEENSAWLKFGFHALDKKSNYKDYDASEFKEELIKTVSELERIVTKDAITYNVRLGFCQGNIGCIKAMKECFSNFNILYGADDSRIVYYLSEEENNLYLENGVFRDEKMGICIKKCEKRLEYSTNFTERVKELDENKIYPFFTHETVLLKDDKFLDYIEALCKSAHVFVS